MGAFHRPAELARTCRCSRNRAVYLANVCSPGSEPPLTQRRLTCSRGGIASVKSTSVALLVVFLMLFLIPSCQYLEFAEGPRQQQPPLRVFTVPICWMPGRLMFKITAPQTTQRLASRQLYRCCLPPELGKRIWLASVDLNMPCVMRQFTGTVFCLNQVSI